MENKALNVDDLIEVFYRMNHQRYEIVAPNVYPCWKFKEMDIMAIRKSGFIDEIEIKLTRSDYLADFKKTVKINCGEIERKWGYKTIDWQDKNKHECLAKGLNHCNYFSFLMPEELAEKCEIPEYSGLYTFDGNWVKEVKKPKRLHKRKISLELKYQIARKLAFRFWESKKIFK